MVVKIKDRIRAIDVECSVLRARQQGLEQALNIIEGHG